MSTHQRPDVVLTPPLKALITVKSRQHAAISIDTKRGDRIRLTNRFGNLIDLDVHLCHFSVSQINRCILLTLKLHRIDIPHLPIPTADYHTPTPRQHRLMRQLPTLTYSNYLNLSPTHQMRIAHRCFKVWSLPGRNSHGNDHVTRLAVLQWSEVDVFAPRFIGGIEIGTDRPCESGTRCWC